MQLILLKDKLTRKEQEERLDSSCSLLYGNNFNFIPK